MPRPSAEEVLVAAKKLIDATPDFVYVAPSIVCRYNSGGDVRYPGQCGCLLGQALLQCGYRVPDTWEGSGIASLIRSGNGIEEFLDTLQAAQDSSVPWEDAWAYALEQWKSDPVVTDCIKSLTATEPE